MITIREYARPATLEEAWQLEPEAPELGAGRDAVAENGKNQRWHSHLTYLRWG